MQNDTTNMLIKIYNINMGCMGTIDAEFGLRYGTSGKQEAIIVNKTVDMTVIFYKADPRVPLIPLELLNLLARIKGWLRKEMKPLLSLASPPVHIFFRMGSACCGNFRRMRAQNPFKLTSKDYL